MRWKKNQSIRKKKLNSKRFDKSTRNVKTAQKKMILMKFE